VTLSVAIGISLIVSLTTTPMMCARFLKSHSDSERGWLYRTSERMFDRIVKGYGAALSWVLAHPALMLVVTLLTIGVNIYL